MRATLAIRLAGAALAAALLAPAPAAAESSFFFGFGHHFGHGGYYGHPYGHYPYYRYPYRSHFGIRTYFPYRYDPPRPRPETRTAPAAPAPAPAASAVQGPAPRAGESVDRSHCREFTKTVTIAGEEVEAFGTACRQADGSWRIVE